MFGRNGLKALGLICLVLLFTGCSNTEVGSIQITPATQSLVAGQTVQFSATGTVGHGSHPASAVDVTSQATWTSSTPAVATVSATGLATAVSAGTSTITASLSGSTSASATVTVTGASGGSGSGNLTGLSIIPGSQSVATPNQTSQFIAIGTTTSGTTQNVTGLVAWSSSSVGVATITGAGLATAQSQGTTTITAIATNPDKSVVTGTATFTVAGGTTEPITALTLIPGTQAVSALGQTGQFFAIGTVGGTGLQQDVTNSAQIKWISSIPSIATVTSGLATGNGDAKGVSAGTSTITAQWTNPDNSVVTATASVVVTTTSAPEPLLSLTIVPSSITVGNLQGTGNFLAIGTFSTVPYVRDLTNTVTWLSSLPNVFPVSNNTSPTNPGAPGGIVTAYGNGSGVIIAEATSTDGTIQTATATFSCPLVLPDPTGHPPTPGSCFPGSQASALLSTVTVYNEGLNTTNWLITAPSATGTPDVIHCGGTIEQATPQGSVCVATYPISAQFQLILTAPPRPGVAFGGWSSTCTTISPNPSSAAGPNTCTIMPTETNQTVGVIFNNAP